MERTSPSVLDQDVRDDDAAVPRAWSFAQKIAFRFVCSFLVLYNLAIAINLLPWMSFLSNAYEGLWHTLVPWVAIHAFHLSGQVTTYFRTGSGDTTLGYIEVLCQLVIAAVATIIWSLIDRKRTNYRQLHGWLRLYVRYVLAYWMLVYGFAKLIPPTQFPTPYLGRLLERYGDFSPMGLLWTFMGYSRAYTYCCGFAEAAGGALLLFRRTTTLGAVWSALCMANVLLLNLSYDTPVKLFSGLLLFMALFLAAPELPRLANFWVFRRPAVLENMGPPAFTVKWMRTATVVLKVVVIGYFIYLTSFASYRQTQKYMGTASTPPVHGIYEVDELTRNGQPVPPLVTDANYWRDLAIENYLGTNMFTVRLMNDSLARYRANFDAAKKTITIESGADKGKKGTFSYTQPDASHVVLQGKLSNDSIGIKMHRVDESKFLIVSRGFHWISELPFNK